MKRPKQDSWDAQIDAAILAHKLGPEPEVTIQLKHRSGESLSAAENRITFPRDYVERRQKELIKQNKQRNER